MSPDRWEHIQELYHAALELEPTQRSAFLKETCGNDEIVCREVEALLASHGKAGSFLEAPARRTVATVALNILFGAASLTRANILRYQGVPLPPEALHIQPLEDIQIKEQLS